MSSDFQVSPLADVCLKIGSGATPRGGKEAYRGGDFALIRSQNVYNEGFTPGGLAFINKEQADQLSNVEVMPGDVLLNITGDSVARCCSVPDNALPARVNQHVSILRADEKHLHGDYLRYFLISRKSQNLLLALASGGATRNALTKGMLESFLIQLPPFSQQKAIAHILGTLDDKIELNRRTNETLEGIAKALFKSWFVDFDPVRAKVEGRPTGLPDEISELFPDSFEESELGGIPSGWSCSSVYDLADYVNGASHSSKTLNENRLGYPVIKINELKNGFTDQTKYWDADFKDKHLVVSGDILFSWSGNPDTSIGTFVWSKQDGLLNQHIFKVVPQNSKWRSFVLSVLRSNQGSFADIARDKQTTGLGHVTVKDLKEMMCPIASVNVMSSFSALTDDIFNRCQNLILQIDVLKDLRDALLPRLISGELRVPDVEKMLEEVGI
ncbi:Putative Type I restriction-modification system S subunit [Synechococcus sp. Minos11]|uniref:restriction endonuclease subunit S n=1 Tax=Synechococcus sp. Minos11 TaxID=221341 RepID=UPI0016483659|nr:restriction endonuclease subunit S [Synechococcus sp. Minos11]QNJ08666.1 Putative Type I restriction-modification system S subunit [Synechococcus sp. Minos11]